jgi:hypothetical protein
MVTAKLLVMYYLFHSDQGASAASFNVLTFAQRRICDRILALLVRN